MVFKDQAGDLENAPTPPSPFTSDTTTPDATAATSTQENCPITLNRGLSVSRALGLSESDGEGDGQMFAYVRLSAWVWTIAALITFSRLLGCRSAGIVDNPSEETADTLLRNV